MPHFSRRWPDRSPPGSLNETEQDSLGVQRPPHKSFLCPLLGYRLPSASLTFSEFSWVPSGRFKHLLIRAGREKTGNEQSRAVQSWGRVPILLQVASIAMSLSSPAGTKAFNQKEDNFRPSTRFLEHHPVTSALANQKKAIHPAVLSPNSAFFPWVLLKSSF